MLSWTEATRAYYAGLLDAEGSVSAQKSKTNGSIQFSVQFAMTRPECLTPLSDHYGMKLSEVFTPYMQQRNCSPYFHVSLTGSSGRDFITQVGSYLIVKKTRADIMISSFLCDNTQKQILYERLREMNRRGVD